MLHSASRSRAREPVVFLPVNGLFDIASSTLPAQDHQIDGVQRQLDHALISNCIHCLLLWMSDAVVIPLDSGLAQVGCEVAGMALRDAARTRAAGSKGQFVRIVGRWINNQW